MDEEIKAEFKRINQILNDWKRRVRELENTVSDAANQWQKSARALLELEKSAQTRLDAVERLAEKQMKLQKEVLDYADEQRKPEGDVLPGKGKHD